MFSSHQLDLVEDVCQDVVIIDHGRIVLSGVVEELKAASPRRSLEIAVNGSPWMPDLANTIRQEDGRVRVFVDAAVDLEAILADARAVGEVTRFNFEPPTLADLFLDAAAGRREP